MRAMLVLKMGCQQWLEDYGGDTSGFVYKSVKDPLLHCAIFLIRHDLVTMQRLAVLTLMCQDVIFSDLLQEGSQSPAGAAQEFCVRSRLCGKAKVCAGMLVALLESSKL